MQSPTAVMVDNALNSPAYPVMPSNRRIAVDPNSPRFRQSVTAMKKAQDKREARKLRNRKLIQRVETHAKSASFNPVTLMCPPPKPSGSGSCIVIQFADYHAKMDAARKRRSDLDWAFAVETQQRRAREAAFAKHIQSGGKPFDSFGTDIPDAFSPGEAFHVHGPDCNHDHDNDHAEVKSEDHSAAALVNEETGSFYAAGSDSSGNRLAAPVLVVDKNYEHTAFEPVPVAAPAVAPVVSANTQPQSESKRLADGAWLVTWMLANGRSAELKSAEALKKLKADTHSLRRGMGVKKDAIPSDEVKALMTELGVK